MSETSGWSHGVVRKISALISARLVAQVIGIGWFLGVARVFDSGELGILAAGLVAFAAVSMIADAGTTWSIAREVTGHPERAWPVYVQALALRAVGVVVVGGAIAGIAAPLVERRVFAAIVLGVVLAGASGASELGMATLRAVGTIGPESLALPLERFAFLLLATAVVASGRGPNVVLLAYLATNVVTALVMYRRLRRHLRPVAESTDVRLWSAETRRVGVAFAVLAVGPRANALALVMLADRLEVADYSVAARPIEQFALTIIGFATTMLPLLRSDHLDGRDPSERMRAITAGVAVIALPGVLWAMARPEPIIDLIYGADRYPGAPAVLALVAVVAISWPLRGLAGLVMVARGQASELARISLYGLAANLALVIPLTIQFGAVGAAAALLVTDVATTSVLVHRSRVLHLDGRALAHRMRRAAGVAVAAGVVGAVLPFFLGLVVVCVGTGAATLLALSANRAVARSGQVNWA